MMVQLAEVFEISAITIFYLFINDIYTVLL